jgi:DNA-binding SARP family transcriptional activator
LRFPDRKCIALLAVLALDGPCTRAHMATLLWDGHNDADARRNLRRELHRLREAGFDGLLSSDADTLQLKPGVEVDTAAFLAAPPDPVRHDTVLAAVSALASYGAGLLAGFDLTGASAFNDWLAARRDTLAQRWRGTAQACAAALEGTGDLRGALRLASELVQHDTLQEGHYCRAMRLHAALGEREAALAVYEQCRRQLGRELGLKPLAQTVALADEIRAGASVATATTPAVTPTVTPPRATPLPATVPALQTLSTPPMVGRQVLLAEVQSSLAKEGLVLLQGEPGMGKTRLVQALAAATAGSFVHPCRASDRRVPFAALVRWLRAATVPAGLPGWVRSEVSRLLPDWGTPPPPIRTDAERMRLFEALRVAWGAMFAGARLHVFDDWQFVDDASAGWWGWWIGQADAAASGPAPAAAVLVAQRPGQAGAQAAAVLADALAAACATTHEVHALQAQDMYLLVQALSGTQHPQRFAQRLWLATGGHPLYALETLQHLLQTELIRVDEHGQWLTPFDQITSDYQELPIAPSVQAAVMQRINSLADAPRRLAEAACLTDGDFDLPLVAAASALSDWDAVQALDAALLARVWVRHEDKPGMYRFVHDLFAQTLAATLSPERRQLIHRNLGQRLAQDGAPPARVAEHLEQGAQTKQETADACAWRVRALAAAHQRMALDDMLAQAARILALSPGGPAAVRAHLGRSAALAARSQGAAALQAAELANALLLPQTDVDMHVDVLATRAALAIQGQGNESILAALDSLLGDKRLSAHQRGRLLTRRSGTLRALNRPLEADAALDDALAAFGDEPSKELGAALDSRARNGMARGDFNATLVAAQQAVAVLRALDDPGALAAPLTMSGVALLCMGRLDEALAELQPARALAHQHGLVAAERGAILNMVPALLGSGRAQEALACLDEGYALSPTFRGPAEQQAFLEARYQCRVDIGDLGAALTVRPELLACSATVDEYARRHSGLLVAADLPLLIGDATSAALALDQVLSEQPHVASYLAVQALAKGAWLALEQQQPALALQRSSAALALPSNRPEDEALRCAFHAAALLANGQPAAARLALVAGPEGVGAEILSLYRTVALRVQHDSGGVEAALAAAALAQLQAAQVPPLSALCLADALSRVSALPKALHTQTLASATQLHTSLAPHPQAQALFGRRFARWLVGAKAAGRRGN